MLHDKKCFNLRVLFQFELLTFQSKEMSIFIIHGEEQRERERESYTMHKMHNRAVFMQKSLQKYNINITIISVTCIEL